MSNPSSLASHQVPLWIVTAVLGVMLGGIGGWYACYNRYAPMLLPPGLSPVYTMAGMGGPPPMPAIRHGLKRNARMGYKTSHSLRTRAGRLVNPDQSAAL